MRFEFKLSTIEIKKFKKFEREMNKKYTEKERYCGAVGGFYSFVFTPTGIGIVVSVKTALGDEKDITDYSQF